MNNIYKILIFIVSQAFLGIDSYCYNHTTSDTVIFENDTLLRNKTYLNDNLVKVEYFYLFNNQKHSVSHYEDGALNGKEIEWNSYGDKVREFNWKDGKLNGTSRMWYDNGSMKLEADFENGIGLSTEYYENGSIKCKEMMEDMTLVGECIYWCENGQLISEFDYSLDTCTLSKYYCNGQKQVEGVVIYKSFNIGLWREWYENGQLMSEGHYVDKVDSALDFDKMNMKVGTWTYWSNTGDVIKKEEYVEGKLVKTFPANN